MKRSASGSRSGRGQRGCGCPGRATAGGSSWTTAARSRRRRSPWPSATSRRSRSPSRPRRARASSTIRGATRRKAAVARRRRDGGDVLLIGTGLTMIDMVLSLERRRSPGADPRSVAARADPEGARGFRARAGRARTRLPHGQCAGAVALAAAAERRGRLARGGGFAAAAQPCLVAGPDHEQQRRFLRHARPWWDVHRHRIAPEVARQIADLVAEGRLEIVAGRIVGDAATRARRSRSTIRRRGRDRVEERRFAFAFNCTGPLGAIERTRDPLLQGLLDDGLVRPDHLGMGLEVDERSRAAGVGAAVGAGAADQGPLLGNRRGPRY